MISKEMKIKKKKYYESLFLTQTMIFIMNVYFTPVTMVN